MLNVDYIEAKLMYYISNMYHQQLLAGQKLLLVILIQIVICIHIYNIYIFIFNHNKMCIVLRWILKYVYVNNKVNPNKLFVI